MSICQKIPYIIDPITDRVNDFVYELLYGRPDTGGRVTGTSLLGETYEFEVQDYSNRPRMRDRLRSGAGIIGGMLNEFMDGFNQFRTSLFGETGTHRVTASELFDTFRSRMPRALRAGLTSGLVRTVAASAIAPDGGLLSSLILPGGPIGAALLGVGSSMVTQSETFQRIMFGDIVDEDGNRAGGIIPSSLIEAYNEHGRTIKRNAGLGVLGSFFLPGGPILGAITGIGAGMISKSDAFQQFMFGDDYQDKENRSIMDGAFGKLMKKLTSTKEGNDGNPKLASFLGGAGLFAGIAQGVGFLPSMLLPGGPILGSIFGLSAGIAASSEKFQKFLFGEKDEDGKRSGGLLTKFANWFDINVGERFRVKMAESNDRIYEFLNRKILFPIQDALDPIKQLGLNVLDDIKEAFHNVTDPVVESFKDNVTRPLGEWMREKFLNPITKRLKSIFGMIGKAIGGIVTSPIKLLTGLGNVADFINGRRALKEEKRNRREQFKENIKENGLSGLISGVKNLRISKEEKEQLLRTGKMEYRAKREENRQQREEELQAQMEERRSKTQELQDQFEEDMKFGKGSGWRKPSKRTQEKQAEMLKKKQQCLQEQNLIETGKINEKLEMVNKLLESGQVQGEDTINTLVDMKNALVNQLKELGEKFKGTNASEPPMPDMPADIRGMFSNAGIEYPQLFDIIDGSDESDVYKASRKLEFIERMMSKTKDDDTVNALNGIKDSLSNTLKNLGQSHEDGLDLVPYDGYIAELHEGEMVVPSSPAGKMRDMFSGNNTISRLNDWVTKREDAEKQDRDDNALGLTDEEAAQQKELADRKNYDLVSRKGVDYLMDKRREELKEKEEKQWKNSVLDAILSVSAGVAAGASSVSGLGGSLLEGISKMFDNVGLTGLLAGLAALLGGTAYSNYSDIANQTGYSVPEVMQGKGREERKDVDENGNETYVYDNQLISGGSKLARLAIKPGAKLLDAGVNAARNVNNAYMKTKTALNKAFGRNTDEVVTGVIDIYNGNVEVTSTIHKRQTGIIEDLITMGKKAMKILSDKAIEKFPKLQSVANVADDIFKKISSIGDDVYRKFGTKIATFIADLGLDFTGVGTVIEFGMTAYDVLTGYYSGNVGNLFGVPKDHVDMDMRNITAFLQGLCKFSFMAVIWLINEITSSLMGIDFLQSIARWIYNNLPINLGKDIDLTNDLEGVNIDGLSVSEAIEKAGGNTSMFFDKNGKFKADLDDKDLQGTGISSAEYMELQRLNYNNENGTKLDSLAWKDKTSQTFGANIWEKVVKGVDSFKEKSWLEKAGVISKVAMNPMQAVMNSSVLNSDAGKWVKGKVQQGGAWLGDKWNQGTAWASDKWNQGTAWASDKWNKGTEWLGDKWNQGTAWASDKWNQGTAWASDKWNKGTAWLGDKVNKAKNVANVIGGEFDEFKSNPLAYTLENTGKLYEKAYFGGKELIGKGTEWAKEKFKPVSDKINTGVDLVKDKLSFVTEGLEEDDSAGTKAAKVVKNIVGAIDEKRDEILLNIKDGFNTAMENVSNTFNRIVEEVPKKIGEFRDNVVEGFNNAIENIGKTFTKLGKDFSKKAIEFKDMVIDGFNNGIKKVGDWFKDLSVAIPKKITEVRDNLRDGFNNMLETIQTTISEKVDSIKKFFSDIDIKGSFEKKIKEIKDSWGSFTGSFSKIFDDLKSHFKLPSLPEIKMPDLTVTWENVKDFFKDFAKELLSAGNSGETPLSKIRPVKYRATDSDFITPGVSAPVTVRRQPRVGDTSAINKLQDSMEGPMRPSNIRKVNDKFVHYSQSDRRWGSDKLGNSTMKASGCGPTSLAMAISQLTGEQITPDTVARLGREHLPGYSKFSLFPSVANKLNMNYNEGYDRSFIINNLNRGLPVILSGRTKVKGTPYTSDGHVVTATKIVGDKVFVNDPRGKAYSGLYPLKSVLTGLNKGMIISPSRRTDVSKLSSGQLGNGWVGDEYENEYKNELGIYGDVGEYEQLGGIGGETGAGQITLADRVLSYARAFLNNTSKFSYSQPRRLQIDTNKSSSKGCGADCSSFVSHVLSRAGDVNIYGTTSQTFWDSVGTKVSEPQIGDVVCQQGHVGLYSGDGNYIHMSGRKAGIKESKAIQNGNQPHRGYKRVLKNPSQLVDPTVPNANTFLGTVVGTSSGHPVSGGTPSGPQASLNKALLIGDSLTVGIKSTFEGKYPNAKAMGKGGKWATQWLKSLNELPDASSVGTVIQWLGINGVHNNKVNLRDSQALLLKLKEKYPNVPIFNMDIFPTTEAYSYNGYKGDWWRGLSQEFNKEMTTWSGSNGVNQINATNGFIQSDGYLDPSKAVDGIHFNTEGYKGVLSNIETAIGSYNSSNQSGGSTPTASAAPAVDTMGVFGKLSNIATGMIGSIFNGKDMFDSFMNTGTVVDPNTPATTNPGTNPDISGISDTAKAVWTFFTGKGYTPEATAGIMGNMEAESGVDPTRIQNKGKGPAAGICQWESWRNKSMRWKGMSDYAASKGKDWTDLQSQLEWLDMELQGKDPSTLSYLKKRVGGFEAFKALTDVDKATTEFMKCFERPGVEHLDRRLKSARDFYSRLNGTSGNISANGDVSNAGMGFQMATSADPTGDAESQPETMNGWAYYRQGDPQWQENINGKYIKPSGCGMASHAMMLTGMFGKKVTPVTVGKWARANNYWNNGMDWQMPPALANKLGLTMVDKETNYNGLPDSSLAKVKQHLKSGYPVILSGLSNNSKDYETPFTSGGHIVFAVGVDGNDQVIINDPRGPHRTKAYSDSGILNKGVGLRGYWAFDKPASAQLPSDWISGDFTPTPGGGSAPTTATTNTAVASAPAADMMGVFAKLGNIGTNMIASIFNGKDMFDVQTTTTDGTTPTNGGVTPSDEPWDGTQYDVSGYDISDLSAEKQGHINAILQPALHTYKTHGLFPSVTIGQSAHESYWGPKSGLATKGKNLFGIKCGSKWTGKVYSAKTGEFLNGKNVTITDNFRAYDSWADSVLDRAKFLSADRYVKAGVLSASTPDAQIDALKKAGYATDPNYIAKLKKMVHDNKLTRFDTPKPPVEVSSGTATDNAGMGDGKTYWAKGFGDNKPKKVSYAKDHAGMGEGSSTSELTNSRRNMEKSIREIDRNMNIVNNTTNINNTGINNACIDMMKVILQELHAINNNTAETAKGVNNIEVVSANEPVRGTTKPMNRKNKNDLIHSNNNTGYDLARKIASYK